MRRIFLDNAATTPIEPEVIETMLEAMNNVFGNPSSIHGEGRQAKSYIERARKSIASLINASISEIYFTSGGTESNNTALKCAVRDLHVKKIISTKFEHHCVSHSLANLQRYQQVEVLLIDNDDCGNVDLAQLEELLANSSVKTLVSIMHVNNEIGTISDMATISALCKKYGALYHADTVQSIGHLPINVVETPIDFLSGGAHKFHGPKGVGFLYINSDFLIEPFIDGGSQEKNLRGGTENIYGIVGMSKALEIACERMEEYTAHITHLKKYTKKRLTEIVKNIDFNGEIEDKGMYTILNVAFPPHPKNEMLLMNFDINGIAVSGGSACTSGADKGSHVIASLGKNPDCKAIRVSFSHMNTEAEIDVFIEKVIKIFDLQKVMI